MGYGRDDQPVVAVFGVVVAFVPARTAAVRAAAIGPVTAATRRTRIGLALKCTAIGKPD
ncbi:hypothetical protein SAMN02745157_2231 [Kaistia soli DSM 19436]|uniref:Uncharacterized protein n=1 Tax=Kaistia soli DSM 19436 TaxID=1122133 RepID=A0A1M5C743_9HYPH|nr:hypothetical protein SAMN02745157_2231 [Kaistia soli DSM 19436]